MRILIFIGKDPLHSSSDAAEPYLQDVPKRTSQVGCCHDSWE
jgi:hypothetical protein